MGPEARLDRVLDSFAWVEYFRGTEAGREVAEGLESGLVGTPSSSWPSSGTSTSGRGCRTGPGTWRSSRR